MHYYQFNIGDYHSHTSHLDPIEDVAYRRMLDWYYLNESPLPESVEDIARLVRMREHCKSIAIVLQEFFELKNGAYIQRRIDSEIKSYQDTCKSRKKAANKRWGNKHKGLRGDASALQVQSKSNAKQEPRTMNHEPVKTIDQNEFDRLFDMFWQSGIRKINKKRAVTLFNNLLKKQKQPELFVNMLVSDISIRLEVKQLGFEQMHPTTYLNGERWADEVIDNAENQSGSNQPSHKLSVVERTRLANEKRERERENRLREIDGQAMAQAPGDLRPPTEQPVRRDNAGELGTIIDGDYTRADS